MTGMDSNPAARKPPPSPASGADQLATALLRTAFGSVALIYFALASLHPVFVPQPARFTMTLLALASGLLLAAAWWLLRRHSLRPGQADAGMFALGLLILVNGGAHLALTGEPWHSTNLLILILAAGFVLRSRSLLLLLVALTLLLWARLAPEFPPTDVWQHHALSLLLASVVAAVVQRFRRQSVALLEAHARKLEAALEALRNSEARLRNLSNATAEAVVFHENGRIIDANETAARMFGTRPEALPGRDILDFTAPETRPIVRRLLDERLIEDFEGLGLRVDGSTFPFAVRLRGFDLDGRRVTVVALRDISSRRATELALGRSEARLRGLVSALPDLMLQIGPDDRIRGAHLPPGFGFPDNGKPLNGQRLGDIVPEETATRLLGLARVAGETGVSPALDFELTATGIPRHFEARAASAGDDSLLLIRDANDRVARQRDLENRTRRALKVAEARTAAILSAAPVVVVAFDREGRIELAEGRGLRRIGLTPSDLIGASIRDLVADAPEGETIVDRALAGEPVAVQLALQGADCELRFEPVRNECNVVELVVVVIVDQTERVRMEEGLRQARDDAEAANRLKDSILANVSHEIRTPMTAILGFSELLVQRLGDNDNARLAERIQEGGQRLLELLTNIIDLASLESGMLRMHLQPHRLRDSVEHVENLLGLMAEDRGLRLKSSVPDDLLVLSDSRREEQILTNLVSNAIRFSEYGTIEIRAVHEPADDLQDPGWVRIEVEDQGIGMGPDFISQAFDEFRQESSGLSRTHEGSGLGLAITRKLVEHMGGSIGLHSRRGHGTLVTVLLPAAATADNLHARPTAPAEARRILLFDDDAATATLIRASLSPPHHVEVVDSDEAAAQLHIRDFDLGLVGVRSPGAADRVAVWREQSGDTCPPLIALLTEDQLDVPYLDSDYLEYLRKPLDPGRLRRLVRRHSRPRAS